MTLVQDFKNGHWMHSATPLAVSSIDVNIVRVTTNVIGLEDSNGGFVATSQPCRIGTNTLPALFTNAANTTGKDIFFRCQDGGTNSGGNPNGGNYIVMPGAAGSGGSGTGGALIVRLPGSTTVGLNIYNDTSGPASAQIARMDTTNAAGQLSLRTTASNSAKLYINAGLFTTSTPNCLGMLDDRSGSNQTTMLIEASNASLSSGYRAIHVKTLAGVGASGDIRIDTLNSPFFSLRSGDSSTVMGMRHQTDGGGANPRWSVVKEPDTTNNEYLTVLHATGFTGSGTATPNVQFDINGGVATRATTNSQITADQNNYAIGAGTFFRLTSDAARTLTGLTGGFDGKQLIIVNVGSQNILLADQSGSSTAANRIITGTGATVTISPDQIAVLIYDATTARWRLW